ncbi:MAG: hypothetical protein KAX77_03585 [Xanthomonadales bacterium]|nr:hypothetical protein [Xanthomonadales bacterium]
MSDDARIAIGLPQHPKTRKLIRRLGPAAGWSLVCLFLWTAQNRHDGDLAGLSDEDLEIAADWTGDAGALVKALVEVRFLDGDEGTRAIHDWTQHNPWAASRGQRVEAAKRAAAARWGTDLDAGRMRGASAPYAEVPKPQCPPPTPTPTPKRSPSDSCPEPQAAAGRKVVGTMPTLGGGEWGVTQVLLDGWTAAYPGIDVKAELRKAKAWLLSNPTNAKTARGMGRFCNGWLERAQNAVGRNGTGPPVERESLQARVARKNPLKLIYDATGESDGQRAIGGPVVGDGGDLRPPLDGSHGGKP